MSKGELKAGVLHLFFFQIHHACRQGGESCVLSCPMPVVEA
jgi:hypothetical protein